MNTKTTPVNVNIARSIAFFAADWRRGDMSAFSAEVLKFFGQKELRQIENAIRHASDPAKAAFDAAMKIQA